MGLSHGGAAERRPHRPGRRLGRDGGRGGPRLRALRQRFGQRAGGAFRRHRAAPVDRALLPSACPVRGSRPIVLDFATSVVAEGKVLVASQGGKKLPDNALIDLDGQHERRPARALRRLHAPRARATAGKGTGAIRAFGDHKGSGLALMCELLGGSLTGMKATGTDAGTGRSLPRQRHAVVLRRPEGGRPRGSFPDRTSRATSPTSRAPSPPAPGGEVLIPGEPEQRHAPTAPARWRAAAR